MVHLPNGETAQSGQFKAMGLTVGCSKRQVLADGENARLTQNEYKLASLGSIWPISDGRSRKIPPSPSTSSRRSAWATGWRTRTEDRRALLHIGLSLLFGVST